MFNFLLQKNKNQIVNEYFLRVAIYFLFFIFASSFILISLFIPSFFFDKYKNDAISSQLKSIKQQNINNTEDPVLLIRNVNRLALALSDNSSSTAKYTDIISKIISLKNKDIRISSITISSDNTNSSETILINGTANTRDSLTSYENEIEIDGFFNSVSFPITDYIKSTDLEFSATLVYKNK